jgi:hypothetical protein
MKRITTLKILWLLMLVLIMTTGCSQVVRESKINNMTLGEDPRAIQSDAGRKTVEVRVSSSVKDAEKETEALRCLIISELQKAGWEVKATAEDCAKCEKAVKEYDEYDYERHERVYGPFACKTIEQPISFLNIDVDVRDIKKVSRVSRILVGGLAGRAELQTIVTISANSKGGKLLLLTTDISAKAPGSSFGFMNNFVGSSVGDTLQSLNETAVKIAEILESIIAQNTPYGKSIK